MEADQTQMTYQDLNSENVKTYLAEHTDLFPPDTPLKVYEYGRNERDGDGYVNHIYRVWNEKTGKSVVVKQAKPYIKAFGTGRVPLEADRNVTETAIVKLRSAIVPQYVPCLYHADAENYLYVCEDCGHLAVMRYELCRGHSFPFFPKQIGEYMAMCNFYTSELYLDPITHKELACRFVNPHMRRIMETILFSQESFVTEEVLAELVRDPAHQTISDYFWEKEELRIELLKLRDIYMKKSECLQHGDLHTSNIMIGPGEMRVFDMEYTHMGPYSADAGYLGGNLLYAYIAWFYRKSGTERARAEYRYEILSYLRDMTAEYMRVFAECWRRDARKLFREAHAYRESLFANFIREMCGFMGSQIISRVGGLAELPDFDTIEDPDDRNQARVLAMILAYYLVMDREKMSGIDDIIDLVQRVAGKFAKG